MRWVGKPGQQGGVVDPLWDDVKCFFDPDMMGSLPGVRVPDASVEDWQAVLDLVAEQGWKCQYSEGETVFPVPRSTVSMPTMKSTPMSTCPSCRARGNVMCSAASFGRSGGNWASRR